MADDATRDRVRALVRDVLNKALPESSSEARAATSTHSSSKSSPLTSSGNSPAVTRDESAKLVITEDGAGVGSAMTANKVPGVRAAACYSVEVARNSREHNGANVLTLGSKTISNDQMREIVKAWLSTELTEERHRKRVGKIEAVERQYQR